MSVRRRLPLPLIATALLVGCATATTPVAPAVEVPAAFRASVGDTGMPPADGWWRGFRSAELDSLIEAARAGNFDIAAAIARIRQADAQVRIAGAALLPHLEATSGASWQHTGLNTGSGSTRARTGGSNASVDTRQYRFGLDASYEIDFWGKNQASRASAVSAAMFSRFDRQTVDLTVTANVASTWFSALAFADRLAVARRTLADAEQTLGVIRGRFAAGTAGALEVAQEEALVAAERATIPALRNQMEQYTIGLGLLTGRPPEAIDARPGTLNDLALPPVAAGLPSALLLRRPDIAALEAELASRSFDIEAARAAFFPSVQLTGSAGFQAAALNALLSPGGALASLAAGLTAPLFDGGALRGRLELARGRYDEILALYRKAIVQAFTDVDNALTAWRFTTEQEALQQLAVETARRAATIARAQMAAGTVDITTVLNTETSLFNAEDTLAQVRLARFQALLGLYKALGGGWTRPEGPLEAGFPGLQPGAVAGGLAVPVGVNAR